MLKVVNTFRHHFRYQPHPPLRWGWETHTARFKGQVSMVGFIGSHLAQYNP
jgi:hypothetical protein